MYSSGNIDVQNWVNLFELLCILSKQKFNLAKQFLK